MELNRYNFAIKFDCFLAGGGSKRKQNFNFDTTTVGGGKFWEARFSGTLIASKELLHCAL